MATVVSAVCAVYTARLALLTIETARANRLLEKKEKNYDAFVARPARDALARFREEVLVLYGQARAELLSHDATTVKQSTIQECTNRLADDFGAAFYGLSDSLFAVDAIDDPVLREQLRKLLEAMEDAIAAEFSQMSDRPERPKLRELVRGHSSAILRLVMDRDPGILAFTCLKPSRGDHKT